MMSSQPFILASKSAIRAHMLRQAGLKLDLDPSMIDERAVEAPAMAKGASPTKIAELLAQEKARDVSTRHPGRIIIGADQTLAQDTQRFSKPKDRISAVQQLKSLRGKTHILASAAAIACDQQILWSGASEARLTMRFFSDHFLEDYLDQIGPAVTTTVGGYQLEGLGIQLFEAISGDYFTILGLPLLPLLAALRTHALLAQ